MGSGSNNSPDELAWMTLTEVSSLIQKRTVSPVEVTDLCLARIARHNPRMNAFITVTADSARAEAKRAEQEIGRGN
jgi:Asp-tRNA(Asn)/Glu-tRNA(Gln) amidotransferase A subunit family amidase